MRMRTWLVAWLLVILAMGSEAPAQTVVVKMGSLNDMTGPTSDVGKDIALGIREAVQYVNDTGGVNGKNIKLFLYVKEAAFGLAIVLFLLYEPRGLAYRWQQIKNYFNLWPFAY